MSDGILKLVASGVQVKSAKRFIAKDFFTEENGFWLWDDFVFHFLDKVEENVGDKTIAIHSLEKNASDAEIRKELGESREEIKLAHFYDLLKRQANGQEGHLVVDGHENTAYIRDKRENLLVVRARWLSGNLYWFVCASSVEYVCACSAGDRFISSDC